MRMKPKDFDLGAVELKGGFSQIDVLQKDGTVRLTKSSLNDLRAAFARKFRVPTSQVEIIRRTDKTSGPVNILRLRMAAWMKLDQVLRKGNEVLEAIVSRLRVVKMTKKYARHPTIKMPNHGRHADVAFAGAYVRS